MLKKNVELEKPSEVQFRKVIYIYIKEMEMNYINRH